MNGFHWHARFTWLPAVLLLSFYACSSRPELKSALVYGTITVPASIDSSNDFSGIHLTIIRRDTADKADTLYQAVTDISGKFTGTAEFREKGIYPLLISRHKTLISSSSVILADKDTVHITGQIPDFAKTSKITSHEEDAWKIYQRLLGNYDRVMKFVRNGQIGTDTLPHVYHIWSNLFWSVYQQHPETIAAHRSAVTTIRILEGWDDSLAFVRLRQIKNPEIKADLSGDLMAILAQRRGLNRALLYTDSLSQASGSRRLKIALGMSKIKMLYDSTHIEQARSDLFTFKKTFAAKNRQARLFAKSMQYDLDSLAPGMPMPSFSVVTLDGDTLTNRSFLGHPYIIEITGLANRLYQQQYADMNALYLVYHYFGLRFLTVPIDASQVTINAFYKERARNWPVARAGSYKYSHLLRRLNVQLIPTRFLVDKKGRIVRKYVGSGSQYLIQDLDKVFHKTENQS